MSSSTSAGSSVTNVSSMECSVPWVVRHTFVDVPLQRSPSTEDFYRPRRVRSAPDGIGDNILATTTFDILPVRHATEAANTQDAPIILHLADALRLEPPHTSLVNFPIVDLSSDLNPNYEPCATSQEEGISKACHAFVGPERKQCRKGRRYLPVEVFGLLPQRLGL